MEGQRKAVEGSEARFLSRSFSLSSTAISLSCSMSSTTETTGTHHADRDEFAESERRYKICQEP